MSFDVVNPNPFLIPTHADIALIGNFPNYFQGFTNKFHVQVNISNNTGATHPFNALWRHWRWTNKQY
ncbi:MAG: hypothetical protein FWE16_02110 [Firmicutes bacterium]|nr:hypothetical protein [Bacillota bacterium]